MTDVLRASVELPTVVFTGLLALAGGLWILSLLGLVEGDVGDGVLDGAPDSLGLAEVPLTLVLTLFALAGWFVSVLASVFLLDDRTGTALLLIGLAVGAAALLAGVACTLWLAPKLGRLFATHRAPSKRDLIGRVAEVRSETITASGGRAEAAWPDGTVSTIDVVLSSSASISPGEVRRGDHVFIVDWLADSDDFVVDLVPIELRD